MFERLPLLFPALSGDLNFFDEVQNFFNTPFSNKKVFPYPINVSNIYDKKTKATKSTIIKIALAGFNKNEISVKAIKGKSLTVEINPVDTVTADENNDVSEFYLVNGISKRKASITWELNEKADLSNFKPSFVNGLLTIILPMKNQEEKDNEIIAEIE